MLVNYSVSITVLNILRFKMSKFLARFSSSSVHCLRKQKSQQWLSRPGRRRSTTHKKYCAEETFRLNYLVFLQMFYLFEPLYHVHRALLPRLTQNRNLADRRVMLGAARDLLKSLYHCRLNSLENYIRPHPANHSTDKLFRRGASKGPTAAAQQRHPPLMNTVIRQA